MGEKSCGFNRYVNPRFVCCTVPRTCAQIGVVCNVTGLVSCVSSGVSNVVITGPFSHSVTNDDLIQQRIGYIIWFPSATPVVSNKNQSVDFRILCNYVGDAVSLVGECQ